MKAIVILLFCVTSSLFATAQVSKSFDVEFLVKGKKYTDVNYYYMNRDTAYQLLYANDKLTIDSFLLNRPSFVVAAIFNGKVINFKVDTDSLFYIKITTCKKGLRTFYLVNCGSDYDEIVKPNSIKKIIFAKPSN